MNAVVKKGCLLLVIGMLLGIGAFVLCIYIIARTEKDILKEGIQLSAAGKFRLTLEKGDFTFFIEHMEEPELALESSDFSVKSKIGESLKVSPHSGSKFDFFWGRKGESTAAFTVEAPGEYTIGISTLPGKCTVMLIKNFDERREKGNLAGGFALLGMGCAGIIVVITACVFFVKAIIEWYISRKK